MPDSRIDELRRRLERDPGSRLFAQLAEEHRKAGDLAEAIRVARAGLAQHPVYPSARLTLGRALLDTGDAAGARPELELVLRQAPDNILASRLLGQALEQLGDHDAALRQYTATLTMAPGDLELAAQVKGLRERLAGGPRGGEVATGPMPRMSAPPLPPATAVRPANVPARALLRSGTPPTQMAPAASIEPTPEVGGTTLPGGAVAAQLSHPEQVRAAAPQGTGERSPDATSEAGQGSAPFSSSTLAELYLRQGLQERAVEVYRQVLAEDPGNEKARARLAALEASPAAGTAPGPLDAVASRRRIIERTIARLEAMLETVRRK